MQYQKSTRKGGPRKEQIWGDRLKTTPIQTQRTLRVHANRCLSSGKAGQFFPVAMIPLLREESIRTSMLNFSFEMAETPEMLMNGVSVRVSSYFIPKLASLRFRGIDDLNLSYGEGTYQGEPGPEYFTQHSTTNPDGNTYAFYRALGIHANGNVNDDYAEAYNILWNWLAEGRSDKIEKRNHTSRGIAPAFWHHTQMKYIKPDFDQALIDGVVPLNVIEAQLPVKGIGLINGHGTAVAPATVRESVAPGDTEGTTDYAAAIGTNIGNTVAIETFTNGLRPTIFAEMAQNGITVSLANIELAKKTAAFAEMRRQFGGIDRDGASDDYLIDLLMQGISLPEIRMKEPVFLGSAQTLMGMSQRYATDAANLDKSATNGRTDVQLRIRMPRTNTGGVVVCIAEILPEQLWERQSDPYLEAREPADLPNYLRDVLDPEPVEVVKNETIDVQHSLPDGTFGYAPLNHQWMRDAPRLGGKFYRPDPNATWDEDRQRIWAVEHIDPTLNENFYIASDIHHNVFADTKADAFEIGMTGNVMIEGNTVFGPALKESLDDYEKVWDTADHSRIDKPEAAPVQTSEMANEKPAKD